MPGGCFRIRAGKSWCYDFGAGEPVEPSVVAELFFLRAIEFWGVEPFPLIARLTPAGRQMIERGN